MQSFFAILHSFFFGSFARAAKGKGGGDDVCSVGAGKFDFRW
jgi:hypothetical protein